MCTQPSRTHVNNNEWVRIPSLPDLVRMHEEIAAPLRPARVIAIALNTYDLSDADARRAIAEAEQQTGLPATDAVRFDPAPVSDAIMRFHQQRTATH